MTPLLHRLAVRDDTDPRLSLTPLGLPRAAPPQRRRDEDDEGDDTPEVPSVPLPVSPPTDTKAVDATAAAILAAGRKRRGETAEPESRDPTVRAIHAAARRARGEEA